MKLSSNFSLSWVISTLTVILAKHSHLSLYQLSPCELLNSRDKFRQAPPPNLPLPKYGEVEGYFAVLITLYHIRKLLSSHGIRPAYDMLEEKLKQGYVVALMLKISIRHLISIDNLVSLLTDES